METIKPLKKTSFNLIFEAFKEAFNDYEIQINKNELNNMLIRRGFLAELSFAAFKEDKITAFTLNGIGSFNGKKTAYDIGTGTIKKFRGQGLATKIFLHSIPFLKEVDVSQYLLEVLQHNKGAHSIYKKLGFKESREFYYFKQKKEDLTLCLTDIHPSYNIKQTDLSHIELMSGFCDFNPAWQNSFEAISRKLNDFKILGAFKEQKLLGYCILESNSGDITQIAVDKKYRRKGIATNLIYKILKFNLNDSLKIINSEVDCISLLGFLKSISILPKGKQFEMIKQL